MDLTSLTFDIGRVFTGGYTAGWAAFSSVDSFAGAIASGSITTTSGTLTGVTIDLTAPAYQGLPSIQFRLAFGDRNDGANNRILVDNLTLNGAVVVPEPHEYAAAAALGLLGFAALRRVGRA